MLQAVFVPTVDEGVVPWWRVAAVLMLQVQQTNVVIDNIIMSERNVS